MFFTSKLKYFFAVFLFYGCQPDVTSINVTSKHLSIVDSVMLYRNKPYSGTLLSKIDTVITYKVNYLDGIKHGEEQKFFFNGDKAELKYFNKGKKTGTHKSWWYNNQIKSEYHFNDTGNYIGTQREWHSNGQLIKEFNYANGKEEGKQKKWDIKGKITTNYETINGERYGLIGSNKCKPDNYVD